MLNKREESSETTLRHIDTSLLWQNPQDATTRELLKELWIGLGRKVPVFLSKTVQDDAGDWNFVLSKTGDTQEGTRQRCRASAPRETSTEVALAG